LAAFFAFFLVAIVLFSLSIFHGLECNDRLLQLFECIESMKSDVKKKMMCDGHATHAPKSPSCLREENFLRYASSHSRFLQEFLDASSHVPLNDLRSRERNHC